MEFSLLLINGLYMFQEALHKQALVGLHCMRIMSAGCLQVNSQPT
jgi:hypothetical protein